jgi:chemotaxis protein CheC
MSINPTSVQFQALQALFDTGVSRANTLLNYLTDSPIQVRMSPIQVLSVQQLQVTLVAGVGRGKAGAMELSYNGEFDGLAQILFPEETATALVDTIADPRRRQIDRQATRIKTLTEVGNIFFNGLMGSLSNVTDRSITYLAPSYREDRLKQLISIDPSPGATAIFGQIQFTPQLFQGPNPIVIFQVSPLEKFLALVEQVNW